MTGDAPLPWIIETHALSSTPFERTYAASPQERASLAAFLDLEEVLSLGVKVRAYALGQGRYRVEGSYDYEAVQLSVISLDPVRSVGRETFSVEYWPSATLEQGGIGSAGEDGGPEALDGDRILFGALISELVSVSIDPYPRNDGDHFGEAVAPASQPGAFADLRKIHRDGNGEA